MAVATASASTTPSRRARRPGSVVASARACFRRIALPNHRLADMDAGFADMDRRLADTDTRLADMVTGLADMDTGLAAQDTGQPAQDTGLTVQDTGLTDSTTAEAPRENPATGTSCGGQRGFSTR